MRIMGLLAAACTLGACELGREIGEEFEGAARDHDLRVELQGDWVFVGGWGSVSVSDGCTPADHPECEYQTVTVTGASASGSVQGASPIGNSVSFSALPFPGSGTISVTGMSGDVATSGAGTVPVIGPDEAIVEPACGRDDAGAPFLAPTGAEISIRWDYLVDGQPAFGHSDQVYSVAPDLVFVEKEYNGARYQTPTGTGLAHVTSTYGESSFDYELYDPTTAQLAPIAVTDEMAEYSDRFAVDAHTQLGGRDACVDSLKQLRSETPDVCVLEEEDAFVESIETTAMRTGVMALVAGTCSLSIHHIATGLDSSVQFEVDPVPILDRGWDATCEVEPGTTCGVRCSDINCWKPVGCNRGSSGALSCTRAPDPDDTDPECAEVSGGPLITSAREGLCW